MIADAVTVRVIDGLESVQIKKENRQERRLSAQTDERLLGSIDEESSIRETSQRVMKCKLGKRGLGANSLGKVDRLGKQLRRAAI